MRCFLLVRYFLIFYWMSEVGPTCFSAAPRPSDRPFDQGKKKKTEAADAPHQSRVRFCGPGPREELVHPAQGPVVPTMLTSANKAKNRLSFCEPGPPEQLVHQAQGTPCMPTSVNKGKKKKTEAADAPHQSRVRFCGPGPREELVHPAQGPVVPTMLTSANKAAASCEPGPRDDVVHRTEAASTSQQRDAPRQRHVRFAEKVMVYSYDVSSASAKPKLDGLIPLARESEIEELEAPVAAHRQQNKAKRHVSCFSCFGAIDIPSVKREAASCEPGPREETVHQAQGARAKAKRRVSLFSCFGAPYSVKKAGSKPKCWAWAC